MDHVCTPGTEEEIRAQIKEGLKKHGQRHLYDEDWNALNSYREYMSVPDLDLAKNSRNAAKIRLEGNRMYRHKHYGMAMDKYYESICWAPNDSVDLGMGYANCSAAFFSLKEYEFALVCISLAKKYNYPQPLMPKLLERESKCKEMMKSESPRISPVTIEFVSNVAKNPKIPFLAEGITMKTLPGYGRSMVTDRSFKPGDLILDEKIMLRSVKSGQKNSKYTSCQYCFTATVLRSPCPRCVSVIYCSEKCREADNDVHRFECGITKQLDRISTDAHRVGLRLFFYGLGLFHDDVDEMMEFCVDHDRAGPDPFALDYLNYDPLEEFKVIHQTRVPRLGPCSNLVLAHAAQYYWILVKHRPIQELFTTVDQKDFLLQSVFIYLRAAQFLASYQAHDENIQFQLYSIAAVCNHSCVPNTHAVSVDGRLKMVVLRPIQKGEQILTSYNIFCTGFDEAPREPKGFDCMCLDCDPEKKRLRKETYDKPLPFDPEHMDEVNRCKELDTVLVAVRKLMQRYGHLHAHPEFDECISKYQDILNQAFVSRSEHERRVQAGREMTDGGK